MDGFLEERDAVIRAALAGPLLLGRGIETLDTHKRFASSLRTSEERSPCTRCPKNFNIGWVSLGCDACCFCCSKPSCQSCQFHQLAVAWSTKQRDKETNIEFQARARSMKDAYSTKSRVALNWVDSAAFRADMLSLKTPTRTALDLSSRGDPTRKLDALARSFEASHVALISEARRSLQSTVIPPRVVRVMSSAEAEVYAVSPILRIPEARVEAFERTCDHAIRARYLVLRQLELVTRVSAVPQNGDKFVFSDNDPGAPHASMTPAIVTLHKTRTKVRHPFYLLLCSLTILFALVGHRYYARDRRDCRIRLLFRLCTAPVIPPVQGVLSESQHLGPSPTLQVLTLLL
jgi:hypothetical protein